MNIIEIKSTVEHLLDVIVKSDYKKQNYPTCIEDVVDKLNECLEILK